MFNINLITRKVYFFKYIRKELFIKKYVKYNLENKKNADLKIIFRDIKSK